MLQPGTSLFAWLRVLQLGFGVFRHLTRWPSAQDFTLITGDGAAIFRHASGLGLEGIVSKRIGSRYVSGRTRAWLKTPSGLMRNRPSNSNHQSFQQVDSSLR